MFPTPSPLDSPTQTRESALRGHRSDVPSGSAPRGHDATHTSTTPVTDSFTYTPRNATPAPDDSSFPPASRPPNTSPTIKICHDFFATPATRTPSCNWAAGIAHIRSVYSHDPPDFRSTWRDFLTGNNKHRFQSLQADIIRSIRVASRDYHPHKPRDLRSFPDPAPFWWLLAHLEMLILAPTPQDDRDQESITHLIASRITDLRNGHIEALYNGAMQVSSWSRPDDRPSRPDNRPAQAAADSDNWRTANARFTNKLGGAPIGDGNFHTVDGLYLQGTPSTSTPRPRQPLHLHHMPGRICDTIRRRAKNKAAGVNADSLDVFTSLVKKNISEVNADIEAIFDLVFTGAIPRSFQRYFTDTYLFCLYKDPDDLTKLRPLGIPSALRRLIGSHIAGYYQKRFAMTLLPHNFAVGVQGGADFIIKAMQLSVEKYIINPQARGTTPTRAAVLFDLSNMFNEVSRSELLHLINDYYPELIPIAQLLYGSESTVHFRWEDGSWRTISMTDGLHQGCPLSAIFAALVLSRVLAPIDNKLRARAAARVAAGDAGDDGMGSITNLFAYVDDVSACPPLMDLRFLCDEFRDACKRVNLRVNCFKTRIMTSCNGQSILPDLYCRDATLANEIETTLANYSSKRNSDGTTSIEEITSGIRLLGAPIGSLAFAESFFLGKLHDVQSHADLLSGEVEDLQTRLRLFSQCCIQKMPHLLGMDVMHSLPLDGSFNPADWLSWNGPLVQHLDDATRSFFCNLLRRKNLPDYSLQIAQLTISTGGLGIINGSQRAIPDFVITMNEAIRGATFGFRFSRDLENFTLCPSVTNLFDIATNPTSDCLRRFHLLAPYVARVGVSDKCPEAERLSHFLHRVSPSSARSRIKKYCATTLRDSLFLSIRDNHPEHLHHLPGILSPHMSSPLIAMSRSNPKNRLHNWNFEYALLRKLRMPIYDPAALPRCWCGTTHDAFGDHCFRCSANHKLAAHNIIVDGWADALHAPLATAGFILPSTKLDTERPNVVECSPGIRPLDLAFDIASSISKPNRVSCDYPTVGGDVTIAPPPSPATILPSEDVIDKVTANADQHLQKKERRKYARAAKEDPVTQQTIPGESILGELLDKRIILLALAIDPHGRWGPITERFLFGVTPDQPLTFRNSQHPKPNAQSMYDLAVGAKCPHGIVNAADAAWRDDRTRQFYGHSYLAPTPREHTIQRLGLAITKAYGFHLRQATRKMGLRPFQDSITPSTSPARG